MSDEQERLAVVRTFVEAASLECNMTIEQLLDVAANPGFGAHKRPYDWRAFVPPEVVEVWASLPPEATIVAFYMAHTQFLKEQAGG